MTNTSHGWRIPSSNDAAVPSIQTNCGGVENCAQCKYEAENWRLSHPEKSDDQVYLSISFTSVPRDAAEDLVNRAMRLSSDCDNANMHVSIDKPLGELDLDAEKESYDNETMLKVYQALEESGYIADWQVEEVVSKMQNSGILFRERK